MNTWIVLGCVVVVVGFIPLAILFSALRKDN